MTHDTESDAPQWTGDEDLYEMLEAPACCLREWAALRNRKYREACRMYAVAALDALAAKKGTTVAAAEFEAVAATGGLTKSYPAEHELVMKVMNA